MKVLIAEDDPICREILEQTFDRDQFEVITVDNGKDAFYTILETHEPMIALLDWVMPGMDGLEVCRRVRSTAPNEHPYLIIVSAKNTKGEIADGLDAGADDFIVKPFAAQELLARLRVAKRVLGYHLTLRNQIDHYKALGDRYSLLGEIVAQQIQTLPEPSGQISDPLADAENAKPPMAPASPPPLWFAAGEVEQLVPRALTDLGICADPTVAQPGERATGASSFTCWAGFLDPENERWTDIVTELSPEAATTVYERALRRQSTDTSAICSFLAETQMVIASTLRSALQAKGHNVAMPLLTRAQQRDLWDPALRIPSESQSFRFVLQGVHMDLSIICYPCTSMPRSPHDLVADEVMASPYPNLRPTGAPGIGERGTALTDHLIQQIINCSVRMPHVEEVQVFEMSPVTQHFHRQPATPRLS
jgi:CheY-like chemotaxis protein